MFGKRSMRSSGKERAQAAAPSSSNHRVEKSSRHKKRETQKQLAETLERSFSEDRRAHASFSRSRSHRRGAPSSETTSPNAIYSRDSHSDGVSGHNSDSPIITLSVGHEGRLFAAHEHILRQVPYFASVLSGQDVSMYDPDKQPVQSSRRIFLPDEEPEVLSAVLEFLYKGDYTPRLVHNTRRNSWELEDDSASIAGSSASATPRHAPRTAHLPTPASSPHIGSVKSSSSSPHVRQEGVAAPAKPKTIFMTAYGHHVLRDTAIYCAASRYGLGADLGTLALRKQGLQTGVSASMLVHSAIYAYANTADSDGRLRAHYLALMIRCRATFRASGTLQAEMERGGSRLFFDLFVAMCNHLDDVIAGGSNSQATTPRIG